MRVKHSSFILVTRCDGATKFSITDKREILSQTVPGILFIVNSLHFGGAEKHVISLLNHMSTDHFRFSLAYLKCDETLLIQLDKARLQDIFCCDVAKKIDWRAVRLLALKIDKNEVDLVVCVNTYSMLYGLLARWFTRRTFKLVDILHTTLLCTVKAKLQMIIYRPVFRQCDLLVYVCENQRTYWRRKGLRPKADKVIYNGIDPSHYSDKYSLDEKQELREQFGFGRDDYVIGICAVLRPEKAHSDLLDAIKRLHAKGLAAKCLIIGDGPERPNVERKIVELGLSGHVAITGFQQDVRPFIAACDVMSLVSHSETFSITALEAMALGKPMILSKVGGAEEQVKAGANGYVFLPGDIDMLADYLARLADVDIRAELSQGARIRVVTDFSLSAMVQAYESAMDSLLTHDEA
jgi:glycosyltransferase involved in cell wall biosynthesis